MRETKEAKCGLQLGSEQVRIARESLDDLVQRGRGGWVPVRVEPQIS